MSDNNKKGVASKAAPLSLEQQQIHQAACDAKEMTYIDPVTGFHVITSYFLKKRGYCCKSGCRHCPYGFRKK